MKSCPFRLPTACRWVGMLLGVGLLAKPALAQTTPVRDSTAIQPPTLTGRIVTGSRQLPVAGASVWLKGSRQAVTTNSNGLFTLTPATPGPYVLAIDAARFMQVTVAVPVVAAQPIVVRLYPLVRP